MGNQVVNHLRYPTYFKYEKNQVKDIFTFFFNIKINKSKNTHIQYASGNCVSNRNLF